MIRGELVDLRPLAGRATSSAAERVANDPDYNGAVRHVCAGGRRRRAPALRARTAISATTTAGWSCRQERRRRWASSPSSPSSTARRRPTGVYNIGIDIDPAHRRRGYGAEAQSLLARYLFDTYTIERVEASTDIENIPEQRALERAGFTREGILRRAQWRAGAWRDVCIYSKLRGE